MMVKKKMNHELNLTADNEGVVRFTKTNHLSAWNKPKK